MVSGTHTLPMARQCQFLALARSTMYYQPTSVSSTDLALMRRIDGLHLAYPFAGARMLRFLLRREGHMIGRKGMRTVMVRIGINALYCKPTISQRNPAHWVYPYLLHQLEITQ